MAGLVDKDKERARLEKQAAKLTKDMEVLEKRLSGSNFVEKVIRSGATLYVYKTESLSWLPDVGSDVNTARQKRPSPRSEKQRNYEESLGTLLARCVGACEGTCTWLPTSLVPSCAVHVLLQAPAKVVEEVRANLQAQKEQLKTVQQAIVDLDQ